MESLQDIIDDYVDEYYEKFGVYPAEVKVNGVVYIWDEYWKVHDEQGE